MTTPNPSSPRAEAQAKALPTLREGSRGPEVRVLQAVLNNKGFNSGTLDGVFGPRTKQAVMPFQRDQGEVPDSGAASQKEGQGPIGRSGREQSGR